MLQLALSLLLSADAGAPKTEAESLAALLTREAQKACAPDGGTKSMCARVKAFIAGAPAKPSPPLLTVGTVEEANDDGQLQLQLLDLSDTSVAVGVVVPDDERERQQFLALIEALGKGQRKHPLLSVLASDVKRMPRFETSTKDGSLLFQVPVIMGGHWLRRSGKKLYLLSFNGDTHRPQIRISEFPDDRK